MVVKSDLKGSQIVRYALEVRGRRYTYGPRKATIASMVIGQLPAIPVATLRVLFVHVLPCSPPSLPPRLIF